MYLILNDMTRSCCKGLPGSTCAMSAGTAPVRAAAAAAAASAGWRLLLSDGDAVARLSFNSCKISRLCLPANSAGLLPSLFLRHTTPLCVEGRNTKEGEWMGGGGEGGAECVVHGAKCQGLKMVGAVAIQPHSAHNQASERSKLGYVLEDSFSKQMHVLVCWIRTQL